MIVYSYQKLGLCSILSLPTYIEREKERRKKRSGSGSQSRSEKHRSWSKDRGNRSREKRSRSRDRKSREQRSTSRDHKKHRWIFSPWYSTWSHSLTEGSMSGILRYCLFSVTFANNEPTCIPFTQLFSTKNKEEKDLQILGCASPWLWTHHTIAVQSYARYLSASLCLWLISYCNVPLFYLFPVKFIHVRINCPVQCQLLRLCEVSLTLYFSLQRLGRYPQ